MVVVTGNSFFDRSLTFQLHSFDRGMAILYILPERSAHQDIPAYDCNVELEKERKISFY